MSTIVGMWKDRWVVDFTKRMEMADVSTYFKKREVHELTSKRGGRWMHCFAHRKWSTFAEDAV